MLAKVSCLQALKAVYHMPMFVHQSVIWTAKQRVLLIFKCFHYSLCWVTAWLHKAFMMLHGCQHLFWESSQGKTTAKNLLFILSLKSNLPSFPGFFSCFAIERDSAATSCPHLKPPSSTSPQLQSPLLAWLFLTKEGNLASFCLRVEPEHSRLHNIQTSCPCIITYSCETSDFSRHYLK